jgi:hypothetical protein
MFEIKLHCSSINEKLAHTQDRHFHCFKDKNPGLYGSKMLLALILEIRAYGSKVLE